MSLILLTVGADTLRRALLLSAGAPDERTLGPRAIAAVIIGALALLAVLVVIKVSLSRVGPGCLLCGKLTTTPLLRLPPQEQFEILAYFRDHEHRDADARSVFVCLNCRTVHDDFSGEARSREAEWHELEAGNITFCKVCEYPVYGCVPGRGDIQCPECRTTYRWRVHERTGLRFFMPPADAKVLPRFRDYIGVY